jgi:NAD(P)-dependent dehydrogenase (short-subunit alcohol dehydrogenase family)
MSLANRFDLKGEVAVVIGGTGGLGGAMAEGLAEAGAKIAILGRNKERGDTKAKELSKHGQAIFLSVDALDPKALEQAEATRADAADWADLETLATTLGIDPKAHADTKALRRAIALAYDTQREIALVWRGQQLPAQTVLPPMVSSYDPRLKTEMSDFDVPRAKALLDLLPAFDHDLRVHLSSKVFSRRLGSLRRSFQAGFQGGVHEDPSSFVTHCF